ncbi:BnaC09g24090D [Brassica napus]|uniref:BnaC09g24090D protein n=1 Tax=Brassica napus TaxID=3708 RepID=A0A078FJR6_BRANA|nr:BnaC09g24090D [Brassica napus]
MTSSSSKVTEQLSFYLPNHSLTQLTPSLISFKSYSGIPRVRHKDFSIPIAKIFKKKTTTELVFDRCLKFTREICLRRP